jgi:hypothetical protein
MALNAFAILAMVLYFNPPAADEGLIPRPLGRLRFSD